MLQDTASAYASGDMSSLEVETSIRLKAWAPEEGDAKAAATLRAYFAAEHATVFRRLLWRRLALIALGAWLLEAFTPLLPGVGLAMTVALVGVAGAAAFVTEHRAHSRLRTLLASPMP